MAVLGQLKILRLSAHENSSDYAQVRNLILFPNNFKGYIVYITNLASTPELPFDQANKFYVNEGGEWHVSPFIEL